MRKMLFITRYVARLKTSLFLALLLSIIGSSAHAECLASFREIKFPDGSAQVKNYVCKSEGAAKPDLRIEFNRLSEAAAGSLIQGEPYPDLERAFGKVRVVDNAVAAEAKKLFDQFGIKSVDQSCFSFAVNVAEGGKPYENDANATCEQRTLWYLTFPDREGLTTMQMPLPADIQYYRTHTDWPPGYAFFYQGGFCEETSLLLCTTIWRLGKQEDLANFIPNLIENDKLLGFDEATAEEIGQWEQDPTSWHHSRKRYFALLDYLTGSGWPEDLLVVSGTPSLCGGGLDFVLHIRQMIMDVAFIQNISDKPISIDALLGSEAGANALRPAVPGAGGETGPIALAEGQLQPGETIAVPLGISFAMASSLEKAFADKAAADKTFNKIQKAKPGTIFELKDEGEEETSVRKTRESFAPPTRPKPATYAFGPELQLSGLVMNGKELMFDQASRNFMELTAGEGYGSCPYLYSFDEGNDTWVRHGKVIHAANAKDKEMTETKSFDGFRGKFRLAEEELEVSYIDSVSLAVDLHDGTGMTLRPDVETMAAQDGRRVTIKAGDRIEFNFALPPTVKAADVKRSTLAITGYYRRYSDMRMALQ